MDRKLRAGRARDPIVANPHVEASYAESERERILQFDRGERRAVLTQPREGYGMVVVRRSLEGPELERYYGLEMALDHAAELLGVSPADLPVPEGGADMGM